MVCQVEGSYLVTEIHYSWTAYHTNDTRDTTYNEILVITSKGSDTIRTSYVPVNLGYDVSNNDSTLVVFKYSAWTISQASYKVVFYKNAPDSIYASFGSYGLGGGSGSVFSGTKIH